MVFEESRKTGGVPKNLSERRREPITNSSYIKACRAFAPLVGGICLIAAPLTNITEGDDHYFKALSNLFTCRLKNIRREEILNVSCTDANCSCDWSMTLGSARSYSPLQFSRLVIWNYALDNKTIQHLSAQMQGNLNLRVK